MLRGIEGPNREPVGSAGGRAHRLGRRHPDVRVLQPGDDRARVPVLGRLRRGVRRPREGDDPERRAAAERGAASTGRSSDAASACTGDPARRMGHEFLFQTLAEQNAATLTEAGVTQGRRDLRALLQHARERVPRLRRATRGRPPHRAAVAPARRGSAADDGGRGRHRHVPRRLLPRPPQRRFDAPRDVLSAGTGVTSTEMARARERLVLLRRRRRAHVDGGGRRGADQRHAVRRGRGHGRRDRRGRLPLLLRDARRRGEGEGARTCASPTSPRCSPKPPSTDRRRAADDGPTLDRCDRSCSCVPTTSRRSASAAPAVERRRDRGPRLGGRGGRAARPRSRTSTAS